MISHKYKTLFVHIPKVAGQSIENVFLKDLGLNWKTRKPLLLMPNDQPENGPPRLAHLTAEEYTKYHYLSEELFNDYFKFSFVRNPWDRAVSFYKYLYYVKGVKFEVFAKEILPKLVNENDFFYKPQYDYIYKDGKLCVDFIGRFENLNEDFLKILKKLNLTNLELKHHNKSKVNQGRNSRNLSKIIKIFKGTVKNPIYTSYREYFDQESVDIISKLYQKDIECFQYSF